MNDLKLIFRFIIVVLLFLTIVGCNSQTDGKPDVQKEFYEALIQLRRFGGLTIFESSPQGFENFLNSKEDYVVLSSKPIKQDEKAELLNAIIEKLTRVSKLDPKSKAVTYYLGVAQLLANRNSDAAQSFGRTIKTKTDYISAYVTLVTLYLRQEDYDRAQEVLRKLSEHHPDQKKILLEIKANIEIQKKDRHPARTTQQG